MWTSLAPPSPRILLLSLCALTLALPSSLAAQTWIFTPDDFEEGSLRGRGGGLPARLDGTARLDADGGWSYVRLDGKGSLPLTEDHREAKLPRGAFTVEAWARLDQHQQWGGLVSVIQDDGGQEKGWLLGTRGDRFCFALSTAGADDGDGKLTYLTASKPLRLGAWHHVVGTYDLRRMRLYLDGEEVGHSVAQSGPVLYPERTWFEFGAYHDGNEHYRMHGGLHRVRLSAGAWSPEKVRGSHHELRRRAPEAASAIVRGLPAEEVAEPIERGVRWLLSLQESDGTWSGPSEDLYIGHTALVVYTLIKCGLSPDHPSVRAGLSWMERQDYERTYDRGCALMAWEAAKERAPKKLMQEVATALVRSCGNGGRVFAQWGYPFGHTNPNDLERWDLSNTQYALLGLRAASRAGLDVGPRPFWKRIVEDLFKRQHNYGGFGYRDGSKATSSMTVAGMGCAVICREVLARLGGPHGMEGRIKGICTGGERWLDKHWTVRGNFTEGDGVSSSRQLYYLYGLERYGSFTGQDLVAGHDWHAEGSRVLVKAQRANGSWGASVSETCFALLFLRRGSRSTGIGPRARAAMEAEASAPLVIGCNAAQPLLAYVRRNSAEVGTAVETAGAEIRWFINGEEVGRRAVPVGGDLRGSELFLEHVLTSNGPTEVWMELISASWRGGEVLRSNRLAFHMDEVEEPWHVEAREDHAKNLLAGAPLRVRASSEWGGRRAQRVVDGRHSVHWWCEAKDRRPWIEIDLRRPVRASAVKITLADSFGTPDPTRYERARDVVLVLNGRRRIRARLRDDVFRKQVIPFRPISLRSVRLEVLSRYAARGGEPTALGIKEIEVFRKAPDGAEVASAPRVEVLVPTSRQASPKWHYYCGDEPEDWFLPEFQERGWRFGYAPFGASGERARTAWKGGRLFLRHTFRLREPRRGAIQLDLRCAGAGELWVNGILVAEIPEGLDSWRTIPFGERGRKALKEGRNHLALAFRAPAAGAAYCDLGIVRRLGGE